MSITSLAGPSFDRDSQCVMVFADEAAQIRPDLAGRLKAGGFGCGFLVFGRNIGAFSIVLEVAENADRKNVPSGALVAHKDEVLRLLERPGIGIFHFSFFVQLGEFTRERDEHLHMKESAIGEGLAQIGHWRPVGKQIFLPGNVLPDLAFELTRGIGLPAFSHPLSLIELSVSPYGIEDHQVPMVALTMPHPKRSFVAHSLI